MKQVQLLFYLLILGWLLSACQQASSELEPLVLRRARQADSFVESVGVNTHVGYPDTIYGNYPGLTRPSLRYLRVRHIRDELTYAADDYMVDRYRDLRNYGIRLTGYAPYEVEKLKFAAFGIMITMEEFAQELAEQKDFLMAVEGPNETDLFTELFFYQGQGFPEGTIAFMQHFYPSIKSVMPNMPVLQTTLAFPGDDSLGETRAAMLGDLSPYADFGNSHNYFAFGEIPSARIQNEHLPLNRSVTPGKPMMSTEGGYAMGESDGYKGTWNDGLSAPFSEDIHGRYMLRYLLEQYRLGYRRTFIYELLDADDSLWGLFRADGSPRPAAYGIRSLLLLLRDATWNSSTKLWIANAFTPDTLDYSLSSLPKSVHSLLFQKSNGRFYLLLWNEVDNWDSDSGAGIYYDPLPATLTVNQSVRRIRTYLPLTHGTTVTETFNSRTAALLIPDHPIVVEIMP
jgi:hypothetical protein